MPDIYSDDNMDLIRGMSEAAVPMPDFLRGHSDPGTRDMHVKFGIISVRTYERVLGDNPCSNGPPISIGWNYNPKRTVSVDDFEKVRLETRRLSHGELVLNRLKRESILMAVGYSRAELAEAVRRNVKIKNQRRQTVHNLAVSKPEEAVEIVKRKVKNIFVPNWKNKPK